MINKQFHQHTNSLVLRETHLLVRDIQDEAMDPVREAGAMAVLLALSLSLSAKAWAAESADREAPQDTSPILAVPPPTWLDSGGKERHYMRLLWSTLEEL